MIDSGCNSAASGEVAGSGVGAMDNLCVWLGVGLGALIILALYVGSMIGYFVVKKKNAHHKWLVEVITISIVVFCSFAIKFFVYLTMNEFVNVGGGMISVWRALYATIGGLTFEGMEEAKDIIVSQCFYYGSSVYAGLMVLSVITMKWNYEVFSRIILWFYRRIVLLLKKNRDIFVFTDLNDETLQLAQSIKKEYEDRKGRNKYIIIFSGPRLDAFDRNDDLCRKIVAEDFLYWSYYKRKKKKSRKNGKYVGKSIAKILHLNNKNVRNRKNKKERRFCVFAYESKNHIPEEEYNMGFVFEDIKNRINKDKMDKLRIEYYILTKRDINYQAYDYKNRELALEFANSVASKKMIDILRQEEESKVEGFNCYKTLKEEKFAPAFLQDGDGGYNGNNQYKACAKILKKAFAKYAVVTAVNEALIISKDAINDLSLSFEGKVEENSNAGEKLNVYILGFGSTGQAIAKAIHMRSAYINERGYATDTHFEVFDSKAKEIAGLFIRENPMWVYNNDEEKESCAKKRIILNRSGALKTIYIKNRISKGKNIKRRLDEEKNKTLTKFYRKDEIGKKYGVEDISKEDKQKDEKWAQVKKRLMLEIICPTIHFNSKSCFDLDILKELDRATGKEANQGDDFPSIIVIALGSDYDNVRMANSLIPDIVKENGKKKNESDQIKEKPKSQTIIVNIWDKNNNDLIYSAGGVWEDDHKLLKLDANLTVKIVGNNTDIYSYKKMADHSDFAKYHSGYNSMNDGADKIKHLSKLNKYLSKGEEFDGLKESINEIVSSYVDKKEDDPKKAMAEKAEVMESYENVDMWKRESTDCVMFVEKMFANLLNKEWLKKKSYAYRCRYLSRVEHQRWLRLHIANGWIYTDSKNTLLKEHNCIIPFNELGDDTRYNLINALMLIIKDIDKWSDESEIVKQNVDEGKSDTDEAFNEAAAAEVDKEEIIAEIISGENADESEESEKAKPEEKEDAQRS